MFSPFANSNTADVTGFDDATHHCPTERMNILILGLGALITIMFFILIAMQYQARKRIEERFELVIV